FNTIDPAKAEPQELLNPAFPSFNFDTVTSAALARRPGHVDLVAQRSWRFAQVKTAGPVVFHSAPGKIALARAAGLANVSQLREDDGQGKGFALYAVDLSK
ncbi:MAG: hypothetical protein EOO78_04170, partial [Oxalobacteraceae bacterium]